MPSRSLTLIRYLLSCSLLTLTAACGNGNIEGWFAADPQLQESPVEVTPSPQQETPSSPQLPSNFPEQLPQYPGATLIESQMATEGMQTLWETDDSRDAVIEFYREKFDSPEWELMTEPPSDTQPRVLSLVANQDDLQVIITVRAEDANNPTEFSLQYQWQEEAASTSTNEDSSTNAKTPQKTVTGLDDLNPRVAQYIKDLAALGVFKGNVESNFQPLQTVNRAEFARWLVEANNAIYKDNPGKQVRLIAEASQPAFADVPASHPDFAVIQGLAEAGIVPSRLGGDSTATSFRPDAPLTRETLLLWKVPLDIRQGLPNASLETIQETWGFQDTNKINPKVLRSLLADYQNGDRANIKRAFGFTQLFQPQKSVTRAEAAAALWYFGYQGEGITAAEVQ
ncbi:MAG: S-layer homology domain-containing protein [Jaaginema sp. PMC 1079.18]|nr:S-layer homology domain-containing protein [Jaaginema sp. PMC 1080.18]MEC4851076.1 S-layer homology domain-containing protein [Jaaginema sp. PMC 1079.18]MEC4865037.1 S-layer homology domain-containing protein [Jaaginema sp. PMC 1078.18]